MSQNLLSAAVVIGALRVKSGLFYLTLLGQRCCLLVSMLLLKGLKIEGYKYVDIYASKKTTISVIFDIQ